MFFSKKNLTKEVLAESEEPSINAWLDEENIDTEGQLAIDVYQTNKKIIVKSTIAGARPEDLKISLHHDLLTIKGRREITDNIREEDYLYRECYWGPFSRSIILPAEVDGGRVEAELESGVLTITLYKSAPGKIEVKSRD